MQIKQFIKFVGYTTAVIALTGFGGANAYMWHRQGDMADNYKDMRREQNEIIRSIHDSEVRLLSAIRDKQESCKVLEAVIANKDYSHTYCKK